MQRNNFNFIASPLLFVNLLISANLFAADPPVITVGATSSSSITLSWTAADKGRVTYSLYRFDADNCDVNRILVTTTNKKNFTVTGLMADTEYWFNVEAQAKSGPAKSECSGPVRTENAGGDPSSECNYPAFSDPPGSGTNALFVPPAWLDSANGPSLVFHDSFDGVDHEVWIDEMMVDALNRSGNSGINSDGTVCLLSDNPYCAPEGKRHSAWYNENLPLNRVRNMETGILEMRGTVNQVRDPTRPGAGAPWENNRLSTSFITTWARAFDTNLNGYIESPANVPGKDKWTHPMYLETKVSFEQMNTPGFRLSMWMMPATYDNPQSGVATLATNDEAYNGNFSDGFELDIFEYEPWKPGCGNLLEFSWINSFATKGKSGRNASGKNHFEGNEEGYIDIGTDWHTFGLLWEEDKLQWVFDEKVVLEITDASKIPDIYQYLIVSREMTNGKSSGEAVYAEGNNYLPPEPGLYGWAGGSNVGDYIDTQNIETDVAQIHYIKIYKPGS